jgi:predicted RNA-binding Zn-ribbon protein involved in translation (DUF1610 family)
MSTPTTPQILADHIRRVSNVYGCSGTNDHSLIAEAFDRLADEIDPQCGLCQVSLRDITTQETATWGERALACPRCGEETTRPL